jgi:thiol-disulfide isomerase/thioredoxin
MKILLIFGAYLICAVAILARQGPTVDNSPFQTVPPAATLSDSLNFRTIVPHFEATDLDGKLWHSSDLQGKVPVVSIWGVYCLPCRAEQPSLQDFFTGRAQRRMFSL